MIRSSREENTHPLEIFEGNRLESSDDEDASDGTQNSRAEARSTSLNSRDFNSADEENVKSQCAIAEAQNHKDKINDVQLQQQSTRNQSETQSDVSGAKPKRNPFCSRCRNHGKRAQVKGHKRHCEYRNCQCKGCKLVECRQLISAAQIKSRRDQKQDEECGRRIEISPPVLSRAADSDPAALIARTLSDHSIRPMGSSIKKSLASTILSSPSSPAVQSLDNQRYQMYPPVVQPSALRPANVNSDTTTDQHKPEPMCKQQQHQQHFVGQSLAPNADQQNYEQSSLASFVPELRSPTSSNLSSAFQMFHLPDQMVSLGNSHHPNGSHAHLQQSANIHPHSMLPNVCNSKNNAQHKGPNEQLLLVEEVYRLFGPLAIFAWLQSEEFNIDKIRTKIELNRAEYTKLVESLPRQLFDVGSNFKIASSFDSNQSRSSKLSNGETSERGPSEAADPVESPNNVGAQCSRRSSSNSNLNQERADTDGPRDLVGVKQTTLNDRSTYTTTEAAATAAAAAAAAAAALSSYPYSLSSSNSVTNGAGQNLLPTPAMAKLGFNRVGTDLGLYNQGIHNNNSGQQNLLWPSLKFMRNQTMHGPPPDSTTLMHPHHLLPHFMHHQHLMAQQAAAHHQHNGHHERHLHLHHQSQPQ